MTQLPPPTPTIPLLSASAESALDFFIKPHCISPQHLLINELFFFFSRLYLGRAPISGSFSLRRMMPEPLNHKLGAFASDAAAVGAAAEAKSLSSRLVFISCELAAWWWGAGGGGGCWGGGGVNENEGAFCFSAAQDDAMSPECLMKRAAVRRRAALRGRPSFKGALIKRGCGAFSAAGDALINKSAAANGFLNHWSD